MRTFFFSSLLCVVSFAFAGCERRAATQSQASPSSGTGSGPVTFDACALLKYDEIEAIQGSPIKEAKSSESSAALRSSQCFYLAAEFSKSVSLSVTTVPSGNSNKAAARDFWKQTFARNQEREKERETEREGDKEKKESLREQQRGKGEEEGGAPLRKIEGIGEEAYWSGTRVGGALYVLKGNAFIGISLGGADTDEVRIEKSKKLAAKAIERL